MKILVTGAAGFIGMHTALKLLEEGYEVVGIDNLNAYYEKKLKEYRLEVLLNYKNFKFINEDLKNRSEVSLIFKKEDFRRVIHLAAQAGVRYSIEAPFEYIDSNIVGTTTVLEGCRNNKVEHLVYASSSSVYGMNNKIPFSEEDRVDSPVSLYAATKKSNELMAHTYSHLYKIPTTGLRFFTVYGPAGRPDMAPWLFTKAILEGKAIKVFNNGNMRRDFTYIDDIVDAIAEIQNNPPICTESSPPYEIYNIGNNNPVQLLDFIKTIEKHCGVTSEKIYMPMQPGDVPCTYADVSKLTKNFNYKPSTKLDHGIGKFVQWYKDYLRLEI